MYNFPYFQPPSPHVEIAQVDTEQDAWNTAVASGLTKILFSRDDKTVYVKSMAVNGQVLMDIFDRRTEDAKLPPSDYVTKEELTKALEGLKGAEK